MQALTKLSTVALAAWMLVSPGMAVAQSEPPAVDPPGRVGRLARITGTVSFRTNDQTDWQPAALNYPVTSGQAYWTEPGARADIEIAGTRLVLDQGSELDIETLDDHRLAASLVQGDLALTLRQMEPGDSFTLRTPRGTVTLAEDGSYVVATGDTGRPGTVTVIEGHAQIVGPGISLAVGPHQTATITGQDSLQASLGPQASDAFIAANTAPARPLPTGQYVVPEQVQEMTGGAVLADTGSWENVADYGQVWYPPVEASWVPYRHGHWAYVLPWGWTWVDDAPWGFAPFHYGRWLQIGPRWGWMPGEWEGGYRRPIYAPALVAFVGFGAGVALGARFGSPVGWVPLGPREHYRPSYGASLAYTNRVNFGQGQAVINNNYINRRVMTVVPASTMTNSRPVARNTRFVSPQTLGSAQPMAQPSVRPTLATAGIAPNAGRQLGLAPGPMAATPRQAAPGPPVSNRPGFAAPNAGIPVPTPRQNFAGTARPMAPTSQAPARPLPQVERPSSLQPPRQFTQAPVPQPQRQFTQPAPQRQFAQPAPQQPQRQFTQAPAQQPQRQFAQPAPQRAYPSLQQPQLQRPAAPAQFQQPRPQYTAPQPQHYAAPQQRAAPSSQASAPARHCFPGQRSC
jgi:hypothetical protein